MPLEPCATRSPTRQALRRESRIPVPRRLLVTTPDATIRASTAMMARSAVCMGHKGHHGDGVNGESCQGAGAARRSRGRRGSSCGRGVPRSRAAARPAPGRRALSSLRSVRSGSPELLRKPAQPLRREDLLRHLPAPARGVETFSVTAGSGVEPAFAAPGNSRREAFVQRRQPGATSSAEGAGRWRRGAEQRDRAPSVLEIGGGSVRSRGASGTAPGGRPWPDSALLPIPTLQTLQAHPFHPLGIESQLPQHRRSRAGPATSVIAGENISKRNGLLSPDTPWSVGALSDQARVSGGLPPSPGKSGEARASLAPTSLSPRKDAGERLSMNSSGVSRPTVFQLVEVAGRARRGERSGGQPLLGESLR